MAWTKPLRKVATSVPVVAVLTPGRHVLIDVDGIGRVERGEVRRRVPGVPSVDPRLHERRYTGRGGVLRPGGTPPPQREQCHHPPTTGRTTARRERRRRPSPLAIAQPSPPLALPRLPAVLRASPPLLRGAWRVAMVAHPRPSCLCVSRAIACVRR
jgi:hypothetical protein